MQTSSGGLSDAIDPVMALDEDLNKTKGQHVVISCYDFRIGGHSTHTLNFARALRERGHRVGALVPEPFGELHEDFQDSLDYIEVVRRGLETRTAFLRRLVKRITALNADVLINNGVPTVQATFPFLPTRLCRISVVHNCVKREIDLGLANGDWVDWIVAVSDNIREILENDNSFGAKILTIPVGIQWPLAERKQAEARTPLRLIYVGRLEAQKNLPALLRVLSCLHQSGVKFSMTVVGGGAEYESTRAQTAASNFRDQIRFLGVRSQREVARLLDEHDFLLMTSHYEGTPHVLLEAMAHGLVALVSRLPGATDRIITHEQDGFLCDRHVPGEYVEILKKFTSRPAKFSNVSRAARNTALTRYSAKTLAEHYELLFKAVDEKSKPPANKLKRDIAVLPALIPNFPGLIFQCKHRLADIWRRLFRGRRAMR